MTEYFAKVKNESFKTSKLRQLIENGQIDDAKKFVLTYFCKIAGDQILQWRPFKDNPCSYEQDIVCGGFDILETSDFYRNYLKKMVNGKFDIVKWFREDIDDIFHIGCRLDGMTTYEKNGELYVNLSSGYLHNIHKKYDEYSEKVKHGVREMLNHIRSILCSENTEQYEYIISWLSKCCVGKKMRTALLFKSPEGTGKSIFTEFIVHYVLGLDICYRSSDIEHIISKFNAVIHGKLLNVMEEVPCLSKHEWEKVGGKLKTLITENTHCYEDKNEKRFMGKNITNFIINTNVEAIKNSDGRRYAIFDVSGKMINNKSYFTKLASDTHNQDVGEAFFSYMLEYYETIKDIFNEDCIPTSQSKIISKIQNIHPIYNYIKTKYVLQNKGINKKYKDLEKEIIDYFKDVGLHIKCRELSEKLRFIGIELTNGHSNYKYVIIEVENLKEIFYKKGWIDDIDEFQNNVTLSNIVNDNINDGIQDDSKKDTIKQEKDMIIADIKEDLESLKKKEDLESLKKKVFVDQVKSTKKDLKNKHHKKQSVATIDFK